MTSNTEFYYTLSTIPQVLAAFLGLSSIFLIYTYTQLKEELIGIAANIHNVLSKYDNYNKFKRLREILLTNINSKSVKSIRTTLKFLFTNSDYIKVIDDEIKKNPKDKAIKELIDQSKPYIVALEKELVKATTFVQLSFYIGIFTIISSLILLPFIPEICTSTLMIYTILLILFSFLSITFMVWIIFRFINLSKQEFSMDAKMII